jgi:hypothetical protein
MFMFILNLKFTNVCVVKYTFTHYDVLDASFKVFQALFILKFFIATVLTTDEKDIIFSLFEGKRKLF